MTQNREELLNHLAASLKDAQQDGGAILLVGAGISVSAGIPPAQKLMKIAIENFPNYFTEDEQRLAQEDLSQLQYNDIMGKLSSLQRKEIFNWHIKGNELKNIPPTKLNFAHLAIAQLLKQGYIKRVLTTNFDPLLINACYMVGMYPLPAIYDLGSAQQVNPELFDDPCLVYLNGQHAGQIQRNTSAQLKIHKNILHKVVQSTGCKKTWIVAGYSGENDPLMDALNELRPYNNWLYWLEYNNQISQNESHQFLESDEECKVIYECDADETFISLTIILECNLDFLENPHERFQLNLDEIEFNTHKKLGDVYKSFLDHCIRQFHQINFQNQLEYDQKFKQLTNIILDQSNKEDSYRFKEFSKPSLYKNIINERLDNLVKLKENLEKAEKIQPDNFWVLIMLSYTYLTIYSVKKRDEKINPNTTEFLQRAENTLNKLKSTNEYASNHNNLISRVLYNQACLEILKENTNKALELLEETFKQNLTDQEPYFSDYDIQRDAYLKLISEHPEFKKLCDKYLAS